MTLPLLLGTYVKYCVNLDRIWKQQGFHTNHLKSLNKS